MKKRSISREELLTLADNLYLEIDEHQIEQLLAEFDSLFNSLEHLDSINLDKYEPRVFGINTSTHWLRDDKPKNFDRDAMLKNANCVVDNLVVMKHE